MEFRWDTLVDAEIERNMDTSVTELVTLCAQPSVSARGEGIAETAGLVCDMLERRGLQARIVQTNGLPVVYAEGGSGDRTLLFYNHYDVQPPEPHELWDTPAFEPQIRDGKLFARGVADDKGEICCRLAALDALLAVHGELPCRVKFLIEGEEEIGSVHLDAFVREHADLLRADACLWEGGGVDFTGRPLMMLGMRGLLYVELRVRTLSHDGHSGGAHLYPNAAWRLVWALASLKDQREHIRIPGFYDDVRELSALDMELLEANLDPEGDRKTQQMMGIPHFLGGAAELEAARRVFLPTCNIAGVVSGHGGEGAKTIVPAQALAKLDFRLVPDQDPDDVSRKLRAHLDAQGFEDIELTVLGGEAPGRTPPNDPYVRMCAAAAEAVYGVPPRIVPLVGGTGPIHPFVAVLRTPILTAGCGYPGAMPHAPNENIRLDSFLSGARHVARLIANMETVEAH